MKQTENGPLSTRNLLIFNGMVLLLLLGAAVNYGPRVFAIAAMSIAVGVPIELIFKKIRGHELDASLFTTPLVFALLVPSIAPLWLVGIGSGFAVFFGKCIFGGLGKTVFNPALVGAIFVTVSFPVFMTTQWLDPISGDVTDSIPVLQLHLGQDLTHSIPQLLLGQVPGMLGETFILLAFALGMVLIALKIADWRIPLAYLGSYFVLMAIGFLVFPEYQGTTMFVNPFYSLITGGIVFAAFFLATDPATAPQNTLAKYYFGFGLAALTLIIRTFGTFQEGYFFAIIIMNAVAPLLDEWLNKNKSDAEENTQEAEGSA